MTKLTPFPYAETTQLVEQLMTMYHHEVNSREAERQQVAAYLNDMAIQTLSALHIHFSLLHTAPEAQIRRDLANVLPLFVDLMAGLTSLARQLRPFELDSIGLHEALQLTAEEFATSTPIRYEGTSTPQLPSDVATAFYQLAQTSLQSWQNKAQAAAEISMQLQAEETAVRLTIQPVADGLPAHQPDAAETFLKTDLLGLMIRFQQLNGRVALHTSPSGAAVVTAVWPWFEEALQDTPGGNPVQNQPG